MQDKVNKLIYKAKHLMKKSHDPIHDFNHVSRVVEYTKKISKDMNLTSEQKQAVILAAWWHDVSRTIPKKPSLFLMSAIDDTISAFMLWMATIRCGLFGRTTGIATRIIFCKSIGTGAILTRILFNRKNRVLVDIVQDADAIDMLDQERSVTVMRLIESSRFYRLSYKISVIWSLKMAELNVKTEKARIFLKELLAAFIIWVKEKNIFEWYVKQFGLKWVVNILAQVEDLLRTLNVLSFENAKYK